MRIALLQTAYVQPQKHLQLDRLAQAAHAAHAGGAALLVASEMFLTGYNIGAEAVRALAEPVQGEGTRRIADIARSSGVAIACGYPERGLDGRIFNAALLVSSSGEQLLNYRKTHLFGALDLSMFSAGDALGGIATIDGVRVGLLICYDVEYPEAARVLALAGADLILAPTAQMEPYRFVQQHMIAVRAFENRIFIAYANCCGQEGELHYYGESVVCNPEGVELARAGAGEELLFADLDLTSLPRLRSDPAYLHDRRPQLYSRLTAPSPPTKK